MIDSGKQHNVDVGKDTRERLWEAIQGAIKAFFS
jgi:hypothetical protein